LKIEAAGLNKHTVNLTKVRGALTFKETISQPVNKSQLIMSGKG